MKKNICIVVLLFFIVSGCATVKENKKTSIGAATGAVVGAGVGYAIGKGTGAGVGAVVGGLLGGAIGYMMDNQEREFRQALATSEEAAKQRLATSEEATKQREQEAALASVKREQDVLMLTFKSDVLFDMNSSVLKTGAYSELDRVATILNKYPETRIRIEGHTDSTGSEAYNLKLSEQRAQAVKAALIAKNVDAARLETVGFGETRPVADNNLEAGRQLNRRVEMIIAPIQG